MPVPWRDIEVALAEGGETTVGRELDEARRAAAAGHAADAFEDVLELAMFLDGIGRPGDALELLTELREFIGQDVIEADRWPWIDNTEGIAARHAGDWHRAYRAYERMQEEAEALPAGEKRTDLVSTAQQNLGVLLSEAEPERARELLRSALEAKAELEDYESAVDILMSLGLTASERGDFDEAEELLDSVISIGTSVYDRRLLSAAFANRGGLHVAQRDFQAAEADFRRGLRNARLFGDELRIVLALLNMGSVHADQGEHGRAMRYYRQAIRAAENLGASGQEAQVRRALALALQRRGRSAEARQELQEAARLAASIGDRQREAQALADLGAMALEQGDTEEGLARLEAALAVLRAGEELADLRQALRNLAEGYRLAGRREEGDAALREAWAMTPEGDHEERVEVAKAGVRLWTQLPANGPRASTYLQQQLAELSTYESPDQVAWTGAVGASVLSSVGAPDDALPFFDEALPVVADSSDERLEWRVRNDRAIALAAVDRYDDALEDLGWCLAVGERWSDRALRQQAHSNLGEVSRRAEELEAAETHHREALALAQELLDQEAHTSALGGLALTLSNRGQWNEARALYEQQLAAAERLGDRRAEAAAVGGLAAYEHAEGRFGEAASMYERAARLNAGEDAQHYVEDLVNALLAWTEAARYRKLQGAGQRLATAAEHYGREQLAAEAFANAAASLLADDEREGAVSLYGAAIRLMSARVARLHGGNNPDAADSNDEVFLTGIAEGLAQVLGPLITAGPSYVGDAEVAALLDDIATEVEGRVPRLGQFVATFVEEVRQRLSE